VLLRTADLAHSGMAKRRTGQGSRRSDVPVMIIKTPWAVLRALFGSLLLAPLALTCGAIAAAVTIMSMHVNPLPAAGAYGAGAFVACYGYGPGSDPPRRQLGRFFGVFARSRMTTVVVPVILAMLLVATVTAAATHPHDVWPLSTAMAWHLNSIHHLVERLQARLPRL
jgi:ABC-type transport system involved in cytochrome c biogenesis permease subunit